MVVQVQKRWSAVGAGPQVRHVLWFVARLDATDGKPGAATGEVGEVVGRALTALVEPSGDGGKKLLRRRRIQIKAADNHPGTALIGVELRPAPQEAIGGIKNMARAVHAIVRPGKQQEDPATAEYEADAEVVRQRLAGHLDELSVDDPLYETLAGWLDHDHPTWKVGDGVVNDWLQTTREESCLVEMTCEPSRQATPGQPILVSDVATLTPVLEKSRQPAMGEAQGMRTISQEVDSHG